MKNAKIQSPAKKRKVKIELTARQEEILGMLNSGLKYREIAGRLFISHATVRTHASNIYKKLGVKNKTQAMVKYYLS